MSASALPVLSLLESRVLGVLVEKELTTPDYYPLSLNALIAGCNQKTSRNPVLNAGEDEVQMALDALKRQTLVIESSGASGRVWRYAHNMGKVIGVPPPIVALLAVLMLKGPQTPGELRIGWALPLPGHFLARSLPGGNGHPVAGRPGGQATEASQDPPGQPG